MPDIKTVFAEDGQLAQAIPGFRPRQAQTDMAKAVVQAIDEQAQLVVEAGTGTGKTFAYLAPALLGQHRCIVSTGTKNLQEQLYHRDLPVMRKALASNKSVALLKGRANYLCLHRLRQHSGNTVLLDKTALAHFSDVRAWANTTDSGDIGELQSLPEDSKIIPFVTSTVDNCLGRDCVDYEECYLVKARKKAMEADLVVVNHHLFFADLALKDTGFGELIPDVKTIIFDEAHQLPEIASTYFGESLSSRQLQDLVRDLEQVYRTQLKDADQLGKVADKLRLGAADLRLLFPEQPERGHWLPQLRRDDVQRQVSRLQEAIKVTTEVIKLHLGREKELDTLFDRCISAQAQLVRLLVEDTPGVSLWYETTQRHIVLHQTPLDIADKFAALIAEQPKAWVFTSATITVDDAFAHYKAQMGIPDAQELALSSAFDYQQQALLCVPRFMPEPSQYQAREHLLNVAVELIKASKGRCFLLFTSHASLQELGRRLPERVSNPLLLQGSTSKRALLEQYLKSDNAVLLGTGAFWEGVDVRGDALTCVMIDKLPFAAPDDPLLQARITDCRKRGGNPFAELQIPQAVITLKQGAGRLIRDVNDKGVLVICDNRLVTKDYGRTFLRSLPAMRRTRGLSEAVAFLRTINEARKKQSNQDHKQKEEDDESISD